MGLRRKRAGGAARHAAVVSCVVVVAAIGPGSTAAAPFRGAAAATPAPWRMLQHDSFRSGVSTDATISSTNASSLTLAWKFSSGAPIFTSPSVVWNATLGKRVVYIANQGGHVYALDAVTGSVLWTFDIAPTHIQSSPAYSNGVVYVGASDHNLYALDAATGTRICSFKTTGVLSASPLVVSPDTAGSVVYVGDNGDTGNADGGDEWAIHAVSSTSSANCTLDWRFNGFQGALTGSYSSPSFARDAKHRPLVVFGTTEPDDAVYALNARTGAVVWRFPTKVVTSDNDVGADPAISPPGVNGIAGGAVYVEGKDKIVYALDLTTGALLWSFDISADSPHASGETQSGAALVDGTVYVGFGGGVYAFDAVTGAKLWKSSDVGPAFSDVISSIAVTGPAGARVLLFGDLAGVVHAVDAASGVPLWSFATGAFIYGSAAISAGRVYIASDDGSLYAFAP